MDLGNLSEYGVSRSSTRSVTNPVRRVIWWLISPYFRGAEARIAARIEAGESGIRGSFPEVAVEAAKKASIQIESRLGGLRKDASAVAHRIAGLEEEASSFIDQISGLSQKIDSVAQRADVEHRIAGLEQKINALIDQIAGLSQKIDSVAQGADERLVKAERTLNGLQQPGTTLPEGQNYGGLVIGRAPTGERLMVRQQDHIGKRVIAGEEWEPHVRKAIAEAARPNGIAVDAGAYIGIHTMTMSRYFSEVHAFEPQRGIFQVLCGNLALNERMNVTTHNTALYDRGVAMRLASQDHQEVDVPMESGEVDYKRIGNAAALSFEIATSGDRHVDAIALDDLGLENVALIKVDTQGSDLRVLAGAERTIARSRPVVLFEWERDLAALHGATLDGFFDFFKKLDYDVEILHNTSPDRQADYIAKPRRGSK
jgi:FkbM family methyltransferase